MSWSDVIRQQTASYNRSAKIDGIFRRSRRDIRTRGKVSLDRRIVRSWIDRRIEDLEISGKVAGRGFNRGLTSL